MDNQNKYVQSLDQYEEELIENFGKHSVLGELNRMSQDAFEALLLQRRLLALDSFEPLYNRGLCSLENETAKEIVREIICEEYPRDRPNHREDALHDLMLIGIPKPVILGTKATRQTRKTLDSLLNLVEYQQKNAHAQDQEMYELRILTSLRVAGEVLPGIEHTLLWQEIERRYQRTKRESKYFYPHSGHDSKRVPLGCKGKSHADRLGIFLAACITNEETYQTAKQYMDDCYQVRRRFYRQFKEN